MAKTKTLFVCSNCGEESITWQGRCPVCGEWNTFKEFKVETSYAGTRARNESVSLQTLHIAQIEEHLGRISTGLSEFDSVLGGGIVKGSVILLGGEPGVGKSTLLLQVAQSVGSEQKVIYFSGEESEVQVAGRAKRLGLEPRFLFANETRLTTIRSVLEKEMPSLVIIDSIQTLYDEAFPSTPGSLVQVRECSLKLQDIAKRLGISVILVGHITKEGTVAGPKTLEHMVDVVLYLEGEPRSEMRILRSMKNRFGATHEVGLFQLSEAGLSIVADPSGLFIEDHGDPVPGTTLTAVLEGVRPILVEVQALVMPTPFGYPKRTSLGVDLQRLHILLAILDSRTNASFASSDVFINVVGGYKIQDRGADLALCMAMLSAASGVAIPNKQVFYGEVGLTGEVRKVSQSERRAKEVSRLGYTAIPSGKTIRDIGAQFNLLNKRDRKN
jgi:DNA repair protein RadA/Sms